MPCARRGAIGVLYAAAAVDRPAECGGNLWCGQRHAQHRAQPDRPTASLLATLVASLLGGRLARALGPRGVANVFCLPASWQTHALPAQRALRWCAHVLCPVNDRCRSMPRSSTPARPSVAPSVDAVAPAACFTQQSPSVPRFLNARATRGVVNAVPNNALNRTGRQRGWRLPSRLHRSAAG